MARDPKKPRKKPTKPCASSTGGPGPRNVDQTNWRKKLQTSRIKFDDDAKQVFLDVFRRRNLMYVAAESAGVSLVTVQTHLKNDPEFFQAFQEAKAEYRDHIVNHAQNLMIEGTDRPIIGGRYKDEVVATEKIYPTNLIAMELKKVDPDYKERQEIDMNVKGGVLLVPPGMSIEEWEEEFEKGKPKPGEGNAGS